MKLVQINHTVQTAAYAANDQVGGLITVQAFPTYARANIIKQVNLLDFDALDKDFDLFIFNEEPSLVNDNASFALSEEDQLKLLGLVSFSTYTNIGSHKACFVNSVEMIVPGTFFAALVSRESTTFTAADHCKLLFSVAEYA